MEQRSSQSQNRVVQVGLTQMACRAEAAANLARQIHLVEEAAKRGAQVICTQELFRSLYFCQLEDHRFFQLAETIPGPSTEAFARIAKQYGVVIIASLFEKRTQGLYHNTAVVVETGGSIKGIYRKMHIPEGPLDYAKVY